MSKSILAIETCSESCSVALLHQGKQQQIISTEPRGHANNVLPMIDTVLAKAEIKLSELHAIAFTRGPGAFTGVRIGTSVAQGLAVGANLPLIAISSLAVLAQGSYRATGNTRCLATLDARMEEVYIGVYQLNENKLMTAVQDDQVAAAEQIGIADEQIQISLQSNWQAVGSGWNNYQQAMSERFKDWHISHSTQLEYPEAIDLITLADWHYDNGDLLDAAEALPVYIRDQVVRVGK